MFLTKKKPSTKALVKTPKANGWLARHPYAAMACYFHFLGFLWLSLSGGFSMPDYVSRQERAEAEAYTHESYRQATRERLEDMERVKARLEEIMASAEPAQTGPDSLHDGSADKIAASKLPEDEEHDSGREQPLTELSTKDASIEVLYQASEALLEEIKSLKDVYVAEKLERLEQMGEQAALPGEPVMADRAAEDDEVAQAGLSLPPLTQEEMLQKTTENQRQAREILARVAANQGAGEFGFFTSGSGSGIPSTGKGPEGTSRGDETGNGTGVGMGYDPASPLEVNQYFSQYGAGGVKDLTGQMQQHYAYQSNRSVPGESLPASGPAKAPPIYAHEAFKYSRKISASGGHSRWMMLDAWYFIGPYSNQGRKNIHTRFPPELGVDLDAKYLGEGGRLLKWQYVEYDHLPFVPLDNTDYSVYYAYTEVISDRDRDVWVAIGSDDQSKLWVNDLLIWKSIDVEKPWAIDEGYRRISLKKGRNTFLFRLENGVQRAALSVALADG